MDKVNEIKKAIDGANSIVINVHRSPDLDSIGSSQALYQAVKSMGKKAVRICPDTVPPSASFLKYSHDIQMVAFETFDFSKFDLFLIADTGSLSQLNGNKDGFFPAIKSAVIDHHSVSTVPATLKFVDTSASSTAEILYSLFETWDVPIDQEMATALLAGILADSSMFRFSGSKVKPLETVIELMKLGADKEAIMEAMFSHIPIMKAKLYGTLLSEAEFDRERGFIFAALPFEVYDEYGKPRGMRDSTSDYLRGIEGARFAVVGLEEKKGQLILSFRSNGYDVSKLAQKIGGGGHVQAAGAIVSGTFEEARQKVLDLLRSE